MREYWLVDPWAQQIEFLVCREGRFEVVLPEGGTYRSDALPELTLDPVAFWATVGKQVG